MEKLETAKTPQTVAQLYEQGVEAFRQDVLDPADRPEFDKHVELARRGLGPESYTSAHAAGRSLSMEDAFALSVD